MADPTRPATDAHDAAVALIWTSQGLVPPEGAALARSARLYSETLAAGRAIRRGDDKTIQPMVGARCDIEAGSRRESAQNAGSPAMRPAADQSTD
ncbi:hypothetical protein [Mangrovicoccus algicola]|uniref:Uncharacterized protein n=1 Tax=Mangrovicoccus algicola TaxID=2771008 RepID=A0A8J7CKG4_9RHOB|nr:hypothetical protein [Mangrovicoccus algicola]MBE3638776.1 hypothetical protein [Mangrovicoccus algicola]